jgi:signal transduction histidine kinase/PAS domain-containing protein
MTDDAGQELAISTEESDAAVAGGGDSLLRQLGEAEAVQGMLSEVLAALAALEDADKAFLLQFDGRDTLSIVASAGLQAEHARLLERLPASAHPWADALRAPVAVADAEIEPALTPQPLVRAAGLRGLHAVPVVAADGTPLGVMAAIFRRPLQLSSRQERVAALYARQVAWILSSVRLHTDAAQALREAADREATAERRAEESAARAASMEARALDARDRAESLEAAQRDLESRIRDTETSAKRYRDLQKVTAALAAAASADDVATVVIEQGLEVLGAYAGSLVLVARDGASLEVVRAHGYAPDVLARWRTLPLDAPYPLSEAVRSGAPVFSPNDAEVSRRYPQFDAERRASGTQALAAIPLIAHGRTLGAIGLSFREAQSFDEDVRAFMLGMATMSAQSLERARLYDEAELARRDAQQAAAALELQHGRLDAIIAQMPAGLLIAEAPSGRLVRGNEQLTAMLRRDFIASPDVASYSDWEFTSPSGGVLSPEEFPLARSVLNGERVSNELLRVRRGDGSLAHVMVSATPVQDADGRIVAAIATIADVTEQRRAEEELRFLAEASSILAASLDYEDTLPTIAKLAVPILADACIIDVVAEKGSIRRVAAVHRDESRAAAASAALNMTPDPTALHHPVVRALRTGMSDLIAQYPPAASNRPADEDRLRADPYDFLGGLRPTSLIVVPLFARGRTRGAITLIVEEGTRRYTTADLALAEEFARRAGLAVDNARLYIDARAANSAKIDFLGHMSHELRTPLNAIVGYTELLLMGVPEPIPDAARAQLDRVRNASRHLLHLIDEILAFSRLERGSEELVADATQLSSVMTEAASVIAPLAVERRIDLRVESPPVPITLETDGSKVRHILLNLLSNAVKFTDQGEVVLTATAEDGDVRFEVRDTGIGIPPQYHERIFEPFWQVEQSTSRRTAGTGIGLSVARRLARLLGGDIEVASKPGEGSRFTVRIPRTLPTTDAES